MASESMAKTAWTRPGAAPASADVLTAWPDYLVDALQRNILFLELLRQRGNQQAEITAQPMATVLRFEH